MQKQLLTNGNAFKRTDGRWGGVVWYKDEKGERKRKSFSGTTKAEVNKKMMEYITAFNDSIIESQETKKRLKDSMQNWLEVFKFPSVERTTYDRKSLSASVEKSDAALDLPPRGSPSRIFCRLFSPQAMPLLPLELKA